MLDFQTFLTVCPFPTIDCKEIELGKLLGKGGNANVYRCEINNETYAAKIYSNDRIYEEFYDNLKYELDVAKKLQHSKYSVRVHKVGYIQEKSTNKILILMERLICNGDLYDYIQDVVDWTSSFRVNQQLIPKPKSNYVYHNKEDNVFWSYEMTELQKIKLTRLLLLSIVELHSLNIIHGDIKTNNMVLHNLPKKQVIKLVDFGMSYITDTEDLIDIYYKCGTMGYRAPEQDTLKMNYLSDIYSVGVTIIELWNGDIWMDGDDFKSCRREVLSGLRKIEANNKEFGKLLRDSISLQYKRRPNAKNFIKRFNKIFSNGHK